MRLPALTKTSLSGAWGITKAIFQALKQAVPPVAGIGAIGSAGFLFLNGEPAEEQSRLLLYGIVGFGLLLILNAVLIYRQKTEQRRAADSADKLAVVQANLATSGDRFLNVLIQLREILEIDYRYCTYVAEYDHRNGCDALRREFDAYLSDLLTHAASMFTHYTGTTCAACIKQLVVEAQNTAMSRPDDVSADAAELFTQARDAYTRIERGKADRVGSSVRRYSYTQNTAFSSIMRATDDVGLYFTLDKLTEREPNEYFNVNPNWQKYYDAVAVCALYQPGGDGPMPKITGFVCIDNKGGGFDEGPCRQLLECLSSIVYYTIQMTGSVLVREQESEL